MSLPPPPHDGVIVFRCICGHRKWLHDSTGRCGMDCNCRHYEEPGEEL